MFSVSTRVHITNITAVRLFTRIIHSLSEAVATIHSNQIRESAGFFTFHLLTGLSTSTVMTIVKKAHLGNRPKKRPILRAMKKGNDGCSIETGQSCCSATGIHGIRGYFPALVRLPSSLGRGFLSFELPSSHARQSHHSLPDHPVRWTLATDSYLPNSRRY
jgi:hypothetical protein